MSVAEYNEAIDEAMTRVERLAQQHDAECQCPTCQAAWAVFEALQDNPPCSFCYGDGCSCCNYTGWR